MGFHYAREKQKFDAEWERLSAWYQAEGMRLLYGPLGTRS